MSRAKRLSNQQRGASRSVPSSKRSAMPVSYLAQKLMSRVRTVAIICMLCLIAVGSIWLAPKLSPEIQQVVIEGDYRWLQEEHLRKVVHNNLGKGILQLEIDLLRDEIEQVPWVEQAEIVREFPATLIVRITEQQAIVQWNDQGYISRQGEFIASEIFEQLSHLPNLSSDNFSQTPGQGSFEAIQLYHMLNSAVLVSGESIDALNRNRAGGWVMYWDSGLSINLGRADHLNRTRHALAAWRRLPMEVKQEITEIDARYENGVAISLGALTEENRAAVTINQNHTINTTAAGQI